jgi:hypothetical protein
VNELDIHGEDTCFVRDWLAWVGGDRQRPQLKYNISYNSTWMRGSERITYHERGAVFIFRCV